MSTVFVDYDNIYLSLKRKNDDAAKRFAKDSGTWLQGIISGELITPTSTFTAPAERRIAMNRCYGNPVPRRNSHDNSTDMNSFPFVRHHFLRSGFEVIDCPPLTAQLKNSADIRIVMDIRDILTHETFFDEFIILSGDADFTPVLHRLRAHARRAVVFANDHTAQPYTALSDGEIRESSLLSLLLNDRAISTVDTQRGLAAPQTALQNIDVEEARRAILAEVVQFVRGAPQAVPLETLADRAVRIVGRDKTIGTNWGGFSTFRDLLLSGLPDDVHLSDTAPYTVFDATRHISAIGLLAPHALAHALAQPERSIAPAAPVQMSSPQYDARNAAAIALQSQQRTFHPAAAPTANYQPAPQQQAAPHYQQPAAIMPVERRTYDPPADRQPAFDRQTLARATQQRPSSERPNSERLYEEPVQRAPSQPIYSEPRREAPHQQAAHQQAAHQQAAPAQAAPGPRNADQATQIQQSIARIHDACQAPALAPAEYRVLFDIMAQEISTNGLQGSQTLVNLGQKAREFGLDLKRDDLRFILEVVSESDPWFEQGASANLFASRFRNFVVARCRSQGLSLSSDELDLVEAWFSAQPAPAQRPAVYRSQSAEPPATARAPAVSPQSDRWWGADEGRPQIAEQRPQTGYAAPNSEPNDDEFPRIVRSRLRG